MKMKLMKGNRAVVKKIDKFEIHLDGDSTYYSAKSLKGARKIASRIEAESKREADEHNDVDRKHLDIFFNLQRYPSNYLAKKLYRMVRDKSLSKEHIEDVRLIKKELEGILSGKMRLNYHQSYGLGSDSWTVDAVKEDV